MAALAEELLRERAASGSQRDDVLSAIVNGTVEGRPLTMEEQVGATTILFTGGLDTTKAALGNIARHLAEDPALEQRLRDPEWIKADLDEFLRYESPIMFMARTVTRDTELGGCPLKAGDRVAVHYASANRDESRFEHADRAQLRPRAQPARRLRPRPAPVHRPALRPAPDRDRLQRAAVPRDEPADPAGRAGGDRRSASC